MYLPNRQQPATTEDKLASILPLGTTTDSNRNQETTPQEQPRVESSPTSRMISAESPSTVSIVVSTIAPTIVTTATTIKSTSKHLTMTPVLPLSANIHPLESLNGEDH
ncbi:hypothetical protein AHF37_01958 [Paragonimus kellicotti]|nr:hypothetical protein AHF37_01958 [Paragonimus kellicotti]